MAKNTIIKKITDYKIIIAIQLIASCMFIGILLKLGALPLKYLLIIILLVLLLCIITFLLMKPSDKAKVRNIIGKIISLLLSIALLFASLKVAEGDSTLSKIAGASSQTTRISVIVLDESSYQELSDLKGETIEVNTSVDGDNMNKAIEAMKQEEPSIETEENSDFSDMANELYSKDINAIMINEAYYLLLENDHEYFEEETRVIWTYEIEEEIDDISKNVDVTNDVFTVYISGIDTSGKVSTVSRSDVNMLVTVNPNTKQILMTSIPRDYYVTLANKGKKDKLTHAGIFGVENSVNTIEGFMNIDINYYARVNFTSLVTMVDALGGITVYSPVSFTTRHGSYQIVKGDNYMDGDKALGFVRERYSLSGGDNDRVKNQQRVLSAMLNKMMSPSIITNYSKVLKAIEGCFETNMSSNEITSLLQMQLNDMSSWDIVQIQLTGTGTSMTGGAMMPSSKLYYMIPDEDSVEKAASLIIQMQEGKKISETESSLD